MRKREDYTRLVGASLVLTLGILLAFQVYILREPSRIETVLAADQAARVARGEKLFAAQCASCHGKQGEGDIGPALNAKKFLSSTDDGQIFGIASSGIPGTAMPAWAQEHGGPFTAEQIHDVVAFIRHWEPTAQDVAQAQPTANPLEGKAIFDSVCYACHGVNGVGTDRAPALSSPELLSQFDDKWFHDTIAQGRPSKGMPTWGTVFSPAQINALVAYIRSWQTNPPPAAPTATPTTAAPVPTGTPAASPTPAVTSAATGAAATAEATVEIARPSNGNLNGGPALQLTGNAAQGAQLFVDNCKKCHGDQGKGGVANPGSTDGTIPPLNPIDDTLISQDLKTFAYNIDLFVEHGSKPEGDNPKEVMDAWGDKGKLTPQQIADLIAYIMSLNK
jgi:mono/diheme cytochrome c family protein